MTIEELRELIKDLPSDAIVKASVKCDDCKSSTWDEKIVSVNYNKKCNDVTLYDYVLDKS